MRALMSRFIRDLSSRSLNAKGPQKISSQGKSQAQLQLSESRFPWAAKKAAKEKAPPPPPPMFLEVLIKTHRTSVVRMWVDQRF